eukprot:scaffold3953_cov169-Amphora_coffeaeformis.AAC.15
MVPCVPTGSTRATEGQPDDCKLPKQGHRSTMQPSRHGDVQSGHPSSRREAPTTYQEEISDEMPHHYDQHHHAALPLGADDLSVRRPHQFQQSYDTPGSSPLAAQTYEEAFPDMDRPRDLQQPADDFRGKHYSTRSYTPEDSDLPHSGYGIHSQPYYPDTNLPFKTDSKDEDSAGKNDSLTAKESFNPPSAFPRDQWHQQTAYSAIQGSHSWQQDAYTGQQSMLQQQNYFYQQQQFSHSQRDQDAGRGEMMYQNPSGQAYPNWQTSGGYQDGTPQWPYGPPSYPSDTSGAEQYSPSHQYGYPQYNNPGGPIPSYPPPTTAANYHLSVPGVAAASHPTSVPPSLPSRQPKVEAIKQKKPPTKKDPDKPKRPLSAYNLFFRDERARMLAELATSGGKSSNDGDGKRKSTNAGDEPSAKRKKTVHGVGFKPMAQRVAARWKALDEESLSVYEKMAAKDLQRYKLEMKEYRDRQTIGTRQATLP